MTSNSYTFALVGYGGMGKQHKKVLQTIDRAHIAGTFDINKQRQEDANNDGLHTYTSFNELVSDDSIDIVLIATPNDSHKDIAIDAMKAGKHVICEKPVTLNSKELEEILDAAKQYDKVFAVHQNRRWDEDYLVMKKLYDEGVLGDVFHVESRVHGSRGIPGDWRHEKAYGGGMLLDWGVHLLDRLVLLIPEKIKSIYCHLSYVLGNEVDDGFRMQVSFESGKTALVEVGTSNYISLPLWYMTGTNGAATIHDWSMNGKVVTVTKHEDHDATPIEAGAGLTKTMAPRGELSTQDTPLPRIKTDIRDFYDNVMKVIEGKEDPIVKNEEVMRIMKLMEAAFLSHKTNSVIDFE
ncbi:Gfo/Idh/MocA family protein [Evansella cellulosilytica]|uniref:Oxidoreductase domain protein n=1 Tax=Evansella cellulosilytica (strain ATCC 21833 / DSM 2522 / FERM P-1141 / JCM 9156 / N-4) TaxID=649639 RepID=E6TWT1_EVAC2|nr:Gfo/Idh/MocA family oxidoreductase [Evansella cellulosilytica]ADU28764.1 oxidoreductase domain protein [Evansella cellulosilytica DSM 2522]